MKLKLLVLALLVATAWAGPQSRPSGTGDAKAHFDRATALHKKGDLDGAIAELREASRLKPDLALAHYNLGNALAGKRGMDGLALVGMRGLDGAIAEYRVAIRLKPDLALAHYNLGTRSTAKATSTARSPSCARPVA